MRYKSDRHRLPPFDADGILLVDKPKTWTSFDVVNALRWHFNIPKIGHCGTLDPAATGLLVLVIGKLTRYSQQLAGEDKIYEASLLLGTETDSCDMDGKVTAQRDYGHVTVEMIRETVAGFVGEQLQTPPMTSAIKKEGQKLYELARKGIEVEREPRPITIHYINLDAVQIPTVTFTASCSKGTYIRTLASDIGEKLGCGAVLSDLRRTQSGRFKLDHAISVDTLKTWDQEQLKDHLVQTLAAAVQAAE